MTKRPTDHLEPAPKKRAGDRQISREEPPSDSDGEQEQVGEGFARADNTALKKRKIFKARRGGQAPPAAPIAVGDATAMGANPFAGISLTPAAHAAHPFAGVSLAAPEAPKAAEPAGEQSAAASGSAATPEKTPESTAPPASEEQAGLKEAPAQQPDPAVAAAAVAEAAPAADSEQREKVPNAPAAPSGNAFASFAASNSKGGFGTLSAGTAAASTSSGNGTSLGGPSFPSFSAAPPASMPATSGFSFTPGAPGANSSFTFSTAAAPASGSFPAMASIFQQPSQPSSGIFGSSAPAPTPAVSLPPEDTHRVTGEEEERSVYTGDGTLFEYDEAERQWRERGRGEMKVNVGARGGARLIMRNRGNFRLLLNANIWPGMKVTPMDGGKGVTFIVMNAAQLPEDSKASEEGKQDWGEAPVLDAKMRTWAYRVKLEAKLAEFTAAVNEHKAPVSDAENNV